MIRTLFVCLLFTAASTRASSPLDRGATFEKHFTGKTVRWDYHHTGDVSQEIIVTDEFRLEREWSGSRSQLVDETDLGKYLFELVAGGTDEVIYSHGFCSIYGEWETTAEAKQRWRSFHESQRFPEPKTAVHIVLKKRVLGKFVELHREDYRPRDLAIRRAPLRADGIVAELQNNGEVAKHVDLVVLGDGYTTGQHDKFQADAKRLTEVLFSTEPFRKHRHAFNVRTVLVPSAREGITNPRKRKWNNSPLGLSFNAFGIDRYMLTYENESIREIAATVPYDFILIIANSRKYGGGGIFNLWATCSADSANSDYVFVHEFGHSFAGLADEYYSSPVAYEDLSVDIEPWEPNVTALLDPERLKWQDLVADDTPIPTPWPQKKYDRSVRQLSSRRARIAQQDDPDKLAELFQRIEKQTAEILGDSAGKVGAFEGASYRARGLYRPELDCIMFSTRRREFCKVCARAVEAVIKRHTE